MNLKEIEQQIIGCRRCERLCVINPFPMPHIHYCDPSKIEVFCIGRNPGLEDSYEDIKLEEFMKKYHERWWVCKVGKYLRERLGDNIIKNKFFFTNVCKCSSPQNATLSSKEKENCLPYLLQQLDAVQPKVILTISNDARQILAPHVKNSKYKEKIPVFNMYHPSYFAYAPDPKISKKQDILLKAIREKLE